MTHMPFSEWNSRNNIGVEAIDEDHRKFLGLINTLQEAVQKCTATEVQGRIMSNLIIHVHSHFAAEEDLMRRSHFPWMEEHQSEHRIFAQRVYELQRELAWGNRSLAIEMLNAMNNWFQHHVTGTDRKLQPFVLNDLVMKR